jgi:hypothetical protein
MAETQLRVALQRAESRRRLALQALHDFHGKLTRKLGPVPLTDAAELISDLAAIGELLAGEEVPDVRP